MIILCCAPICAYVTYTSLVFTSPPHPYKAKLYYCMQTQLWYDAAKANKELLVVTVPYEHAAGGGIVFSIVHTILEGKRFALFLTF